jgi:ferrous iron transport protein A
MRAGGGQPCDGHHHNRASAPNHWRCGAPVDNGSQVTLADLPLRTEAVITSVDWPALSERDGRRLRELGFDEGVAVETLPGRGLFIADPIAVRVGRMTVALRKANAMRIAVEVAA